MSVSAEDAVISSNVINEKTEQKPSAEEIQNRPEVRRRIRALMKLQFNKVEVDGELQKEILKLLEEKFNHKFKSIYDKRRDIVSGNLEPTDEECNFPKDSETAEPVVETKVGTKIEISGIPSFWLESMLSISDISEWITEEDESALIHLKDVVVSLESNPAKLVLEFHFEPNEYFNNEVLRKEYLIEFGPDSKEFPCDTESQHPISRKGCPINWKKGKNLLKRYSKTEDLNKFSAQSFFSFFDPPEEPKDKNEIKEDLEDLLWEDWVLGLAIAEKLVPNAVLYYTGVANDYETESESSESDSDSDSSND